MKNPEPKRIRNTVAKLPVSVLLSGALVRSSLGRVGVSAGVATSSMMSSFTILKNISPKKTLLNFNFFHRKWK
jgi:hypothetical protein